MKSELSYVNTEKSNGKKSVGYHVKNFFLMLLLYLALQLFMTGTDLPIILGSRVGIPRLISSIVAVGIMVGGIYLGHRLCKRQGLINTQHIFTKKNIMFMIIGFLVLQAIGFTAIFLQDSASVAKRVAMHAANVKNTAPLSTFISYGFFLPIVEEYLYRGFIVGYWFKDSPVIGAIVSVIFFTISHVPNNPIVFVQYLLSSIAFVIVYKKSQRLEVTMGMHILNNLSGAIQMALSLL